MKDRAIKMRSLKKSILTKKGTVLQLNMKETVPFLPNN
ncbi:hypothetical protein SAMN06295960_1744 [Paenibacillus aquistagni]|uniref:Uncharacterized protein n=1 Tax=Paenibacillus aquistagni TaxID=1852522 RepID=A0A1X7JMW5_9BACL|nr:hypothetical protein SAMN06295960_1744 [Paenibacillus aquistagni]